VKFDNIILIWLIWLTGLHNFIRRSIPDKLILASGTFHNQKLGIDPFFEEEGFHAGQCGMVTLTVDQLKTESPLLPEEKGENDLLDSLFQDFFEGICRNIQFIAHQFLQIFYPFTGLQAFFQRFQL